MKFSVPDMSCGHCVSAIEKAVAEAGAKASCDLDSKTVEISGMDSPEAALAALDKAGFDAKALG